MLLETSKDVFDDVTRKRELLDSYVKSCEHNISGKTILVDVDELCKNLEEKSDWMMENIRKNEWISSKDRKGWFNGYYDNHGRQVESAASENVKMMLTGQVFAIMSGTAQPNKLRQFVRARMNIFLTKRLEGIV